MKNILTSPFLAFAIILTALLCPALVPRSFAQPFAIDGQVISGGGSASAGGVFTMNGTVGQPAASPQPMVKGSFSLVGGFWSFLAVPTPGMPVLSIDRLGADVRIAWPVTGLNFQLQETTDLSMPESWVPVEQPAVTNAAQICVTIPTSAGSRFFRLKSPQTDESRPRKIGEGLCTQNPHD